jgi:hypothetical protein
MSMIGTVTSAKVTAMAGVALFVAVVTASESHAAAPDSEPACKAALGSVTEEWRAIGFSTPSKPAQNVVAGRFGRETSGVQLNGMQVELRRARGDCSAGRNEAALRGVATVRELLAPVGQEQSATK